ncbi:MAG: hypothetical protein HYZ16_05030 [Bacteroidetes bacterium]|nr:hypothetical protein [Bacteroidota bacterium]
MKSLIVPFVAISLGGLVSCHTDQQTARIEKMLYVQVTNPAGNLYFEGSELDERAHFYDVAELGPEGTLLQTGCTLYTPGGKAQLKIDFLCNRELQGKVAGVYEPGVYHDAQISDCTVVDICYMDEIGNTWKLARDSDPNFVFEILGLQPYNSLVTGESKHLIECRFDVRMVNQNGEVASHQGQFLSAIAHTVR